MAIFHYFLRDEQHNHRIKDDKSRNPHSIHSVRHSCRVFFCCNASLENSNALHHTKWIWVCDRIVKESAEPRSGRASRAWQAQSRTCNICWLERVDKMERMLTAIGEFSKSEMSSMSNEPRVQHWSTRDELHQLLWRFLKRYGWLLIDWSLELRLHKVVSLIAMHLYQHEQSEVVNCEMTSIDFQFLLNPHSSIQTFFTFCAMANIASFVYAP